jgi:hypothetical protein
VGFVFALKEAGRGAVGATDAAAWRAWEDRIDALALAAFEVYARCREEVWRLKADQARRLSGRLADPGEPEQERKSRAGAGAGEKQE